MAEATAGGWTIAMVACGRRRRPTADDSDGAACGQRRRLLLPWRQRRPIGGQRLQLRGAAAAAAWVLAACGRTTQDDGNCSCTGDGGSRAEAERDGFGRAGLRVDPRMLRALLEMQVVVGLDENKDAWLVFMLPFTGCFFPLFRLSSYRFLLGQCDVSVGIQSGFLSSSYGSPGHSLDGLRSVWQRFVLLHALAMAWRVNKLGNGARTDERVQALCVDMKEYNTMC